MAQTPANEKLWAMVVFQAKTKYATYPSPGASHWVHQRYIELGGKFEDSTQATHRKEVLKKIWKRKLEEKRQNAKKNHKEEKGKHHGEK
jgi:predicted NUDIX family phosphoesterase